MGIEDFAARHPMGYVHIAYGVVWAIQFGYAVWLWRATRATGRRR